jgi:hypothetical protein
MNIIEARALLGVTASATAKEVTDACDRLNGPAKFAGDIELFRQHNEAVAVIMLDAGVLTAETIDNYRAVTNAEITKMGAKIDQTLAELSVVEGEITDDFIASIRRTSRDDGQ